MELTEGLGLTRPKEGSQEPLVPAAEIAGRKGAVQKEWEIRTKLPPTHK
jgi:hypothetical protein